MINLPYPVYGTITDTDSSNPNGAKVILRNDRSGERINTTTNSLGAYLLDAGNLTSGYLNSDRLTIICAFGDASKESSFLISDHLGGHTVNLTLVTLAESSDTTYCEVQDVLDELGDKTTSDITYERVRKAILRAESEIDERVESTFKTTIVTDELYDFNQYTGYKSPEQQSSRRTDILFGSRNDYHSTSFNDKIKLNNYPILTVFTQLNGATTTTATTLTVDSTTGFPTSGTLFIYNSTNGTEAITYTDKTSTTFTGCTRSTNSTTATAHADNSYVTLIRASRNQGSLTGTDSWQDLQPQVGGGGDFILSTNTPHLAFITNIPAFGKRMIKTSYTYGRATIPKVVEDLCIMLSVRRVLLSKSNSSNFDSINSISLDSISASFSASSSVTYLKHLNEQIDELWEAVGQLVTSVA